MQEVELMIHNFYFGVESPLKPIKHKSHTFLSSYHMVVMYTVCVCTYLSSTVPKTQFAISY